MTESSVRVAVRIRPQLPSEVFDMCHVCTSVTPGEPQVWLGNDKAFTFDHVFNMITPQETVYASCIQDLIDGCCNGYNATILAYGQTGSGKTYTMGTGFDMSVNDEELGIIPRAVNHLFHSIAKLQNEAQNKKLPIPDFKIVAQFMELYNEEIIDLLDPVREGDERGKKALVKIHEDTSGQIVASGLTLRPVSSSSETLQCLKIGALARTTASTKMNVQSSRSHAIFTLHIKQQRILPFEPCEGMDDIESSEDFDMLTSKLHFVDLAGSERLKRTGASGERAREGISINYGLLALGNVISALGDKTRKATHVPYRDSKLTRLLQDSLGGNSQTLMIACVSPSDRDFMETLNTLKYSNRAKNIRNKIVVNQDKSSHAIAQLRKEIQQLQLELREYKEGKRVIGEDGEEHVNDMFHENMFLESENNNLRLRLKSLQETLDLQTQRLTDLLAEKAAGNWITLGEKDSQCDITELIKGYMKEIEDLRVKLLEAETVCSQLRKQIQKNQTRTSFGNTHIINSDFPIALEETRSPYEVLREAKHDVKLLSKQAKVLEKEKTFENCKDSNKEEDEKEKDDTPQEIKSKTNGEVMNGEIEDEEENSDDSDESDSDEKSSAEIYGGDLAQLTNDISIKQKLIEALEKSQHRLQMMKKHYEEKLLTLENKIKETEAERERVLSNLTENKGNKTEEKIKKVKEDFSKKLNDLQSKLKKMQVMKKEHTQAMRNQASCERQIQVLKSEVTEMKKTKVRLINKMKEDSQRHQLAQKISKKEIAQLKKQGRIQDNQIRTLEADKKLKENVLKRKQEEITALRRSNKPMSDQVAGRVGLYNKDSTFIIHRRSTASPKEAKSKWQNLEKNINQLVISRQSINNTEKDMDRYLKQRDVLIRKLEDLKQKRNGAMINKKCSEIIRDYDDNIETLQTTIKYFQENIAECQSTIMQMEEAKEDMELVDVDKFVASLGPMEYKYLLGKLVNMCINQTFQVFQKESIIKELEAKINESTNNNTIYLNFLERLVEDGNTEVLDFITSGEEPCDEVSWSQDSSRSSSPIDSSVSETITFSTPIDPVHKKKGRKKTYLPSEILNSMTQDTSFQVCSMTGSCPSVVDDEEKPATSRLAWSYGPNLQHELDMDRTLTPSVNKEAKDDRGLVRVTSAPTSLQETAMSDISPPSSPSNSQKNRDDNVFSRLTSGSFRLNKPGSGVITPFSLKMNQSKNSPLICTHTAEGHSRAILSLHATDDVLFSGSKDRTVKMWDLGTGKEIQSLGGHPNNVCRVRYNEYSRLSFSVSTSFIKVWDVRENPAKCIQTLSSSGTSNAGSLALCTPSRTLLVPQVEHQINDIALNKYGTTLFSAAHNIVRIWDLRMYKVVGKLNGNHQAAIMCLAVDNEGKNKNIVVTGSKDHYIKIFEVTEGISGLNTAKTNLTPPHYDGIQALAICENALFSGSRDRCIKKWNLKNGNHIQSLNQAHKDWIFSLSFIADNKVLLSGCRGGFLKLWDVKTTQMIGEIKAHSASINAISSNSSCTFSASSDCTIRIWRLKNSEDLSPDSSENFEA